MEFENLADLLETIQEILERKFPNDRIRVFEQYDMINIRIKTQRNLKEFANELDETLEKYSDLQIDIEIFNQKDLSQISYELYENFRSKVVYYFNLSDWAETEYFFLKQNKGEWLYKIDASEKYKSFEDVQEIFDEIYPEKRLDSFIKASHFRKLLLELTK